MVEKLNSIEEAIADIKAGKVIIVVDDEDRENEGDFITAAETITPPPSPSALPTLKAPTLLHKPSLGQSPSPAAPISSTPPIPQPVSAKKEEPRVAIRIPESKKNLISQDAKEIQEQSPVAKPAEPEAAPKSRFSFGFKRPAAPAPAPVPAPVSAPTSVPAPAKIEPAAAEPATATPSPEPPSQPAPATLGGPKPPGAERSLRPKLGGGSGGGGEMRFKLKK